MHRKARLPLLMLFACLAIRSASATTYYIASNGSDSSNGTSKSTPWAHLPGMATWTGSHTPIGGDTFILRGCDHWGNSNFPIAWIWSGSGSSPIVVDRDTSWFNPASCSTWNRAVFDAQSSAVGGTECSGSNQNKFIRFLSAQYVTFNWIELTGYYWNGNAGGACYGYTGIFAEANNSDYIIWSNSYIHNWSVGSASAGDSDHAWWIPNTGTTCPHCLFTNSVVDNSDSSACGANGTLGRCGAGWEWSTTNSVFYWMVNALKPTSGGTFCNNNLYGINDGFDGGLTHPNIIEAVSWPGSGYTYYVCNNYIHNNTVGELQFGNPGDTTYIWNNVDVINTNGRTWAFPQHGGSTAANLYFWNNTSYTGSTAGILTCNSCSTGGALRWNTVDIENNHIITTSTSGGGPIPGMINCSDCSGSNSFPASTRTVSPTDNIVMTPTTATSEGYTNSEAYIYSPPASCTPSTCSTLGVGANLASLWPSGFPTSDTTYACVEQTINTVVQSVCNQRVAVGRATSGPWDVGAYDPASSSGAPAAPTGLTAAVH
jgi:hypothetical protein